MGPEQRLPGVHECPTSRLLVFFVHAWACASQSVLHVLDGVLMPGPLPSLVAQQGELAGVTGSGCGHISVGFGVIAVAASAALMMGTH
jgi:hypothetical protein